MYLPRIYISKILEYFCLIYRQRKPRPGAGDDVPSEVRSSIKNIIHSRARDFPRILTTSCARVRLLVNSLNRTSVRRPYLCTKVCKRRITKRGLFMIPQRPRTLREGGVLKMEKRDMVARLARRIERPSTAVPLLKGIPLPFVFVILLGDRHSVPGGLVNVIVCLYPHLVRYSAEALEAPTKKNKKIKRENNKKRQ